MPSALVLAGTRRGGDSLAASEGAAHKALIEIGGEPMLARVLGALERAGIERVAVSCGDEAIAELARQRGAEILPAAEGPSSSVMAGLSRMGAPLVVTTSDHALLKPEWVRELIEKTPPGADLGVMLAERQRIEQALPGSRRSYLKFSDGEWSGCNLFYLKTENSRRAVAMWQQIEADRKKPWRMVAKLGWRTLLSYALGRLTLAQGIERLGRRVNVRATLVPASDGLAAVDVDKPQDLVDVRQLLSRMDGAA